MAFCTSCGTKTPDGAKFCPGCGMQIDGKPESIETRQVVYDGVIHKCPNCGGLLDSLAVECGTCGYELRGNRGSTVVQDFANEIRRIETEGGRGFNRRIATYISTFPIPNSREELLEFLVLSASNIDLKAYGFGCSDMSDAKKSISYAYYAKFEQAYRKAQTIFGSEPTFSDFTAIYNQKKKEVATAKRNRVLIIGSMVLCGLAIILYMLMSS